MKKLKLSLIIPIYNEEHHIARCIEAALGQHEPFFEIIVVDNNCTDASPAIAARYKQVKVVKEPKQGLIAARNKGFDTASGDILCRIDADAELEPDWSQVVLRNFQADKDLAGVTGLAVTSLIPRLRHPTTSIYSRGYFYGIGTLFKTQVLWGANMAIRAAYWPKAKKIVHSVDTNVHEDQDLSICILSLGGKLKLDKSLWIHTAGQTYHHFSKLREYIARSKATYKLHEAEGRLPADVSARFTRADLIKRYITLYTAGILFALSSLVMWPLDKLMISLGHEKRWFH